MATDIPDIKVDALLPAEMAARAEDIGVRKAQMAAPDMFALAVLAGAFIAMGAVFATTVTSGTIAVKAADGATALTTALPYGLTRLLAGVAFSLGLVLVVVGGAELFTGNNLIVMAWTSRKVSTAALLRSWAIVYAGNFVGAILSAGLVFCSKQYLFAGGAVGLNALNTANAKVSYDFTQALALGILGNALVCMAVWLCYSARSTGDKILAIILPISAFVAAGFEHSIANMYFIPVALLIKGFAAEDFWQQIHATPASYAHLTWQRFFAANLLPVTLGNLIGGSLMVGAIYWFAYLRGKAKGVAR